jgi:hypothetical protein
MRISFRRVGDIALAFGIPAAYFIFIPQNLHARRAPPSGLQP